MSQLSFSILSKKYVNQIEQMVDRAKKCPNLLRLMLFFLFNLLILILFRDERSKKLDDVGDEHDKETSKEGEKQNLEVSHRCCWPMTVFAVITRNFQQTLLEIMYLIFDTAAPPGSDALF